MFLKFIYVPTCRLLLHSSIILKFDLSIAHLITITLSARPNNHEAAASRSRFLASKTPAGRGGCGQNPLACSATEGSRGPDCCNDICTDMRADAFNCGVYGKRCDMSEICYNSHCVKPMSDNQNCGKCFNHCKIGTSCDKGFCDYA
ncbi:hypothetical protein D8674_039771 [Pyrus ussuriensis x Pyrus communis]|uniref:Stigma-specific STIG1-like protein 1 n=1 Tax=Pyrus ussuriensis x Pyrus communis TaxID=2448454 RepID=A0A5N5F6Z7_9ROSA|nr:hypothetical protein D8674_039771 [Pyrus ussuriensis x Pyrus communis]